MVIGDGADVNRSGTVRPAGTGARRAARTLAVCPVTLRTARPAVAAAALRLGRPTADAAGLRPRGRRPERPDLLPAPSSFEVLIGTLAKLVWPAAILLIDFTKATFWPAPITAIVAGTVLGALKRNLKQRRREIAAHHPRPPATRTSPTLTRLPRFASCAPHPRTKPRPNPSPPPVDGRAEIVRQGLSVRPWRSPAEAEIVAAGPVVRGFGLDDRRRQHLTGHQVRMLAQGVPDLAVGRPGQGDPVRDLQAGRLAGLLHQPDDLAAARPGPVRASAPGRARPSRPAR